MTLFWAACGLVLGAVYGWLWATVLLPGDADDRSMAEWQRRQDEFRRPGR